MIEIRHLETLLAVSETGSVAAAAKRVHLTQSALSHQLKALENHYGTVLFERKTTPMRWSPIGKRLVALAYDLQRLMADANRDISRIQAGTTGQLRIAVECHSCFDWLMPSMDRFREVWTDIEQDLVSGFHPDPVDLLAESRADLVIVSQRYPRPGVSFHPLFRYEMPILLANDHPLCEKPHVDATDLAKETLITYPIPDQRLDLVRQVLIPAGINPERRTAMVTEAILQLVASGRGVAALPAWAIQNYLERGYVTDRPITGSGLWCELYAAALNTDSRPTYLDEFVRIMREVSFDLLPGIEPLTES